MQAILSHSNKVPWACTMNNIYNTWYKDKFNILIFQDLWCCLVTKSCLTLCDLVDCRTPGFIVFHYLPEFAQNSYSLSWWCYLTILSSVTAISFCLQSFPVSGSFPINWLFASGGQSIGVSVSASSISTKMQGWFPVGLTGLSSLQSKGLSRVFSNITVRKHQFFSTQHSLWSNSHIHTWLWKKP